jgi:hypothetical protein
MSRRKQISRDKTALHPTPALAYTGLPFPHPARGITRQKPTLRDIWWGAPRQQTVSASIPGRRSLSSLAGTSALSIAGRRNSACPFIACREPKGGFTPMPTNSWLGGQLRELLEPRCRTRTRPPLPVRKLRALESQSSVPIPYLTAALPERSDRKPRMLLFREFLPLDTANQAG